MTLNTPKKSPGLFGWIGIVVGIGFGIVALIGAVTGPTKHATVTPGPRQMTQFDAWLDCKAFVKKGLKAPATAEFPAITDSDVKIGHLSNGRWSVLAYVDSQNSFGAQLRNDFACQVSYSGDMVTLQQLQIGDQTLK
jgi:hypothetical protein